MDLRESPAEAAFRATLRRWLATHLPADWRDRGPHVASDDQRFRREWTRLLHAAGYAGITWPAEYGGRGLSYAFEAIYREETARAEAPEHAGIIGVGMVGPTIIAYGTPAQKSQFLASILSGDIIFCQGFSETEAGSDLAAVRTRAEPYGGEFVVDGRKVWSSYAHRADYCLLLVRSDPASARHRGLTCLLVDMRAAGVRTRPLRQLTGAADFNEIVFDGVRVPRTAALGEVGDGWRVAMTTLAHERGVLGFTLAARLAAGFTRLLATARASGAADDPVVRDRLAQLHVDIQGLRFTTYRVAASASPGPESSIAKLHWAGVNQRMTALALDLLGSDAVLSGGGWWDGYWQREHLRSRGNSIEGGTSEVLRSLLAERVLGLPRSR
ncbi:MAG TPA: acyl-CoA dehydrogenase family protein [Pilimelia sp.]|nr:acyl-CoA dehydrogenase family protein [Pilimelia sp.]